MSDSGLDRRRFLVMAAGMTAAANAMVGAAASSAQGAAVDLALVLAADCSGSVTPENYTLQQRGYADAFRNKDVIRAIRVGAHKAIAVCYFQWSGYDVQQLNIPWTILDSEDSILRFAASLDDAGRSIYSGGTAPAGAIAYGRRLLSEVPVRAARQVIDISGDGRTNNGPAPDRDRQMALDAGITINGLPILHLESDIDQYYERHLIGGPGAFMVPVRDFDSFKEAIRRKLVLEIAGPAPGQTG